MEQQPNQMVAASFKLKASNSEKKSIAAATPATAENGNAHLLAHVESASSGHQGKSWQSGKSSGGTSIRATLAPQNIFSGSLKEFDPFLKTGNNPPGNRQLVHRPPVER
eukprot:CAMPEP_0172676998 /NCGR_PEP_ID=MMETSP1074-20121228/14372_1 /TAXON_ID=2916 /ORGANISM="Ceratium fusus, Strain PA161109" /LENGTH=108 /DNA_ID=CAMNT_0013494765 /DNA_START=244 /DNA_END=566 /DNA_ORIENTATION=-